MRSRLPKSNVAHGKIPALPGHLAVLMCVVGFRSDLSFAERLAAVRVVSLGISRRAPHGLRMQVHKHMQVSLELCAFGLRQSSQHSCSDLETSPAAFRTCGGMTWQYPRAKPLA